MFTAWGESKTKAKQSAAVKALLNTVHCFTEIPDELEPYTETARNQNVESVRQQLAESIEKQHREPAESQFAESLGNRNAESVQKLHVESATKQHGHSNPEQVGIALFSFQETVLFS